MTNTIAMDKDRHDDALIEAERARKGRKARTVFAFRAIATAAVSFAAAYIAWKRI